MWGKMRWYGMVWTQLEDHIDEYTNPHMIDRRWWGLQLLDPYVTREPLGHVHMYMGMGNCVGMWGKIRWYGMVFCTSRDGRWVMQLILAMMKSRSVVECDQRAGTSWMWWVYVDVSGYANSRHIHLSISSLWHVHMCMSMGNCVGMWGKIRWYGMVWCHLMGHIYVSGYIYTCVYRCICPHTYIWLRAGGNCVCRSRVWRVCVGHVWEYVCNCVYDCVGMYWGPSGAGPFLPVCKVSACDESEYIHTYIHTYIHKYIHTYIQT
jgi:hypothetical protein